MSESKPDNSAETYQAGTAPVQAFTSPAIPASAKARFTMHVATTTPDGDDAMDLPGYDILDEVGCQGLAVVYRARQRSLNRVVAIRTICGVAGSEEVAARPLREAAFLARLQHPHVVSILDCLQTGGRVYLVLEYLEGGSLAAKIAGQQQPVRPAVTLVERLARTLAYIHQCGILHCDLKPHNVLLAAPPVVEASSQAASLNCEEVYGIPVLSNFALALDRQRLADLKEGEIRGTPAYMAPEQAGARHQELGPATDIHGLGAILYELLTGRPPVRVASLRDLLQQVMEKEPEPVRKLNPSVDRGLEEICRKCLHKEPAQRYAHGLELAAALRGFLDRLSKRRWF